nr:disease resistance protein rrs1 [Quercus suber]
MIAMNHQISNKSLKGYLNNIGTEVVEGIKLNTPIGIEEHLNAEAFSNMKKLRLLIIGYEQHPQNLIRGPVQLPQGLSYISNELRAIDWHGYPLESMPTSFQPNKLVELRMHYSDIKQPWKGIKVLNEVKLIDLSDSQNLIEIPDLSGAPNLKQLILQRCCGDLFSTMLRRYIINPKGNEPSFGNYVEIPGSEIPKWFSHQNVGGSVNLQVPSDLLGNKLMGIAVCTVFVFRKHHPLHQLHIRDYGDMIGTHYLGCSIGGLEKVSLILSEEFGKIESYQLWLEYFPSTYFGEYWKEIWDQVEANGFSQIEVKFKPIGPGLEVTKCGAHLVFERDIEDLINQTKAGPSNCIITPYDEDGFEDSEKDTKIKRSCDDSDGKGAGPSGEATSNDEPPHLNLIENCYSFYGICTADQLFFSLILLYEEVFGLCWKGETVTLLANEKVH